MEDTGRPRKVQKLDHDRTDSVEDGTALTAAACEKGAEEATESQAIPNETSNGRDDDDDDETVETEVASTTGNEKENPAAATISKNQLKKQLRQEKWEAGKEFRKAKKKEKLMERKERKRVAREQGVHDAPDAGQNGMSERSGARTTEANKTRTLVPITLIIDCGYDELMVDKERTSLSSQLTRSYSDNMRSPYRSHLMVSSFNGLLKERFDGVLRKTHEHWKGVTFMQDDYMAAAEVAKGDMSGPKGGEMAGLFSGKADTNAEEEGEIVYLSSDSPDTLTELKPYSTYIIGGLVDKNRYKGICYKSALDKGIRTAKLPIGEYMKMNSRFVLATNHVVLIMLKWLELGDWGEAFIQVMPRRKGGELKEKEDEATPHQQTEGQEAVADEEATEEATEVAADSKHQDTDNN